MLFICWLYVLIIAHFVASFRHTPLPEQHVCDELNSSRMQYFIATRHIHLLFYLT